MPGSGGQGTYSKYKRTKCSGRVAAGQARQHNRRERKRARIIKRRSIYRYIDGVRWRERGRRRVPQGKSSDGSVSAVRVVPLWIPPPKKKTVFFDRNEPKNRVPSGVAYAFLFDPRRGGKNNNSKNTPSNVNTPRTRRTPALGFPVCARNNNNNKFRVVDLIITTVITVVRVRKCTRKSIFGKRKMKRIFDYYPENLIKKKKTSK